MGPTHQQAGRSASRSGPCGPSSSYSQGQDQALRTQIQLEIEQKAKVCANTQYECTLPRVDSYLYCFRHILQDPNAPYKQCEYVFPNDRRCLEPSPKYDVKKDYGSNYCFEHSRQTQLKKTKSTIGKLVPVETTETLLHGLAHHVKVDKAKQHYMGNSTPLKITVHEDDEDADVDVVTPSVDPFVDVDVTAINDSGRIVLDYASDSSDDNETILNPTYGSSWQAHEMDNSDNESVDSQLGDPLKHAGIYTAEEVTRITKEKLFRLQTLYIDQIHRLQHVLRERRRNYLKDQRAERDFHCSIYDQIKQTPRERLLYEKLKGLNRYHRKHGVEAILQRKYLEKRAKATEGLQQKPTSLPKCSYTEGGVKCGERTLPCCKHCRKHILEDKKQVLFRACGIEKSGVVCQETLAGLFENVTCPLHMELPAQRSFNKRKYESESEGECEISAMEVSSTVDGEKSSKVVTDKSNHPSTTTATAETQEDKKEENVDSKATAEVDAKLAVKTESKRKVIKTETTTPVARLRNTRSSRAAMAKQEDQQKPDEEMASTTNDSEVKQEQKETQENVTIIHPVSTTTLAQMDDAAIDLEESLLPVSVIHKKKPKDEGNTQKPATETNDAKTVSAESEVVELPNESVKEPEPAETGDNKQKETDEPAKAAMEDQQSLPSSTSNQEAVVDTTTSTDAPKPEGSQEETDRQDESTKSPKVTLTTRQKKLLLGTDKKESSSSLLILTSLPAQFPFCLPTWHHCPQHSSIPARLGWSAAKRLHYPTLHQNVYPPPFPPLRKLFFFLAITTCWPCMVASCAAFGPMPGGGGGIVICPPDFPNRAPASKMAPCRKAPHVSLAKMVIDLQASEWTYLNWIDGRLVDLRRLGLWWWSGRDLILVHLRMHRLCRDGRNGGRCGRVRWRRRGELSRRGRIHAPAITIERLWHDSGRIWRIGRRHTGDHRVCVNEKILPDCGTTLHSLSASNGPRSQTHTIPPTIRWVLQRS
uniref:KAT8 regulatory NSL complex subunit 2 n=1 Tax=Anopheles culicifacies TaxID=139723 RepID=A0A182MFL4_9DIPT